MNLPLPVVLRLANCSRSKISKLNASGHLNFPLPKGSAGVAIVITEEAALDIAFITALTRRGFSPDDAKLKSFHWVERITQGRGIDPYQVFQGSGLMSGTTAAGIRVAVEHAIDQADMPSGAEYRRSTDLVVINVEEIRARIQAWSEDL
jgi:hypothetical protein